jgi:copper transport protein
MTEGRSAFARACLLLVLIVLLLPAGVHGVDRAPASADLVADVFVAPGSAVLTQDGEPTMTVDSPAFVAARWLTFASLMAVIGAVAFHFLVLAPAGPRLPGDDAALEATRLLAARIGRGAALFLCLAAVVRLLLQLETLGGIGSGFLQPLLFETSYGGAWFLHLAGALLAFAGFQAVIRGRRSGWAIAAFAGLAGAFGLSLSSHAAAASLPAIAITADALHILAVSGWLGTLLVLAAAIPVALGEDPRAGRFSTVATFVSTFSPRALAMAAIAAGTGVVGGWFHLPTLGSIWGTDYGRALLVKVLLVAAAAGVGAWNWKRVKPRLQTGDAPDVLRRTTMVELFLGALVLLATAVLVALPTP